jgi:hypothetical protein
MDKIAIPAEVEFLGELCLFECWSLRSVIFDPNSEISSIQGHFMMGRSDVSVQFPASLARIDGSCLIGVGNASTASENEHLFIEGKLLLNRTERVVVRYLGVESVVEIPDPCVALGVGSFSFCSSLEFVR